MSEPKIFDRNTIIKIILGTVVGGLAVYFAFRGVSVSQLGEVITQANPWLVIVGLCIVLLNVATITLRWWVMLIRPWQTAEYGSLLGGVYLGQMFNILLPARLGELARIYFVSERIKITKSGLLGSLMLEKVIDIITFGMALLLLITAISLPDWVTESGKTLIYLSLISLVAVIVLILWGRGILTLLTPMLKRLPASWGERFAGILERALTGFDSMRYWKRQLPIWMLTIFSLILSILTNYVILQAVHIQVPITAALFVLIVLQVGSAPPSAPGKLGVFHYLAVLALSVFSVEKDLALAYGVLLYVVALLPKVLIGVGVLLFSRWRLPDIKLKIES
ncbi:MAG: lysylphosphatidylglycerol synthase transmembrane domain-containing protein [Anaerolineales bacterium]